jgi:hypothetical protein
LPGQNAAVLFSCHHFFRDLLATMNLLFDQKRISAEIEQLFSGGNEA